MFLILRKKFFFEFATMNTGLWSTVVNKKENEIHTKSGVRCCSTKPVNSISRNLSASKRPFLPSVPLKVEFSCAHWLENGECSDDLEELWFLFDGDGEEDRDDDTFDDDGKSSVLIFVIRPGCDHIGLLLLLFDINGLDDWVWFA